MTIRTSTIPPITKGKVKYIFHFLNREVKLSPAISQILRLQRNKPLETNSIILRKINQNKIQFVTSLRVLAQYPNTLVHLYRFWSDSGNGIKHISSLDYQSLERSYYKIINKWKQTEIEFL